MSQWWSWGLLAVSLTVMWLAGSSRTTAAWRVGLASQLLWVSYGFASGQPAFCVSSVAYGAVYIRNLRRDRQAALAAAMTRHPAGSRSAR